MLLSKMFVTSFTGGGGMSTGSKPPTCPQVTDKLLSHKIVTTTWYGFYHRQELINLP
jgi:hypothetical protein